MKTTRWCFALVAVSALACAIPAATADETSPAPYRSPAYPWDRAADGKSRTFAPDGESPQSALNRLEKSYRELDLELYASLLTADYRFVSDDPRIDGNYPEGLDRTLDITSSAGLFGATPVPGKPSIASIEFDLGLVGEGADPDHPDSLEHYRLLVAPRPVMTIRASTAEEMHLRRTLLAFYMVRGDAAVLPEGAPANAGLWYLRRWVETPEESEPVPGGEGAAAAGPANATFALAQNPARGAFELVLSLPAPGAYEVEVFDVAGRSLRRRPPATFEAGTSRLELAESAKWPPGIYWIRLSQGGRPLATRVGTRL